MHDTTRRKLSRPLRPKEIAARKAAMAGGRYALETGASIKSAAKKFGSHAPGVSEAMAVLKYGTEAEITGVDSGALPLRITVRAVRERMGDVIWENRKPPNRSDNKDERRNDKLLWAELRRAFTIITGMPRPEDMIKVARAQHQRRNTIDEKVLAVSDWIREFADAWTK